MPLQATSGAASYDAFGGGVPFEPTYIEQIFSTYLYTGNGSSQTITNGIDLSGKGGLVWMKRRSSAGNHGLYDTVRGTSGSLGGGLATNNANAKSGQDLTAFYSDGFNAFNNTGQINSLGASVASWTFRKQPKFFDVVTYTGNGTLATTTGAATNYDRVIPHSLGVTPGMYVVKRTDSTGNWLVAHVGDGGKALLLNTTDAAFYGNGQLFATSTGFSPGKNRSSSGGYNFNEWNQNGATYVAYLFAHNAGGFGEDGTDNVISCGSYTGNGSATGPVVTLGYEPQWLMIKNASGTGNWQIIDNMRGMPVGSADATLQANLTNAESSVDYVSPTATGFQVTSTSTEVNTSASTYIYIAIRRGPMKVPESGTSVFLPRTRTGTGAAVTITGVGFPPDLIVTERRTTANLNGFVDKLRSNGPIKYLQSPFTNAELSGGGQLYIFLQNGYYTNDDGSINFNRSAETYVDYLFRRAPGYFDEVCYTGTGSATTVAHNLGVAPELIIVKGRNTNGSTADSNWAVWSNALTTGYNLFINSTSAEYNGNGSWFGSTPSTLTTFGASESNASAKTYVAYLFASAPGVSKVGSYTGTGTTQTIDCGFTGGARFVMIKRTDSTGDWYVWDSARGIVAGNDSYLLLNSTAAEVTNTDYVDTYSAGFEISSTAPAAINANGGSYIFLAIA